MRLAYFTAVCATFLMVGQATADTYSPFTVNGTFSDQFRDVFALTGNIDIDVTTGMFANASLHLVGEPWTNISSQGSVGSFYDLNIQTPIFNTDCSPCHDTLSLLFFESPLMLLADHGGLFAGGFANLRDAGFDIYLGSGSLTAVVTPLPAALPLFAAGLGVMAWLSQRRKRTSGTIVANKSFLIPAD